MSMLHRVGLLLALFAQIACAQPEIVAKFLYRGQPYNGGMLPYRLFVPDWYDSTRSYPLVVTLHGNGAQGTNNTNQMNSRMVTVWADPINQGKYPCLVVSPQMPMGLYDWYGLDTALMAMIDSLERDYSIDTERLYVTGLSMGGWGTWEMITAHPDRFAAAVPMSGGGSPEWADWFGGMPVWTFHGGQDAIAPPLYDRVMISAMEQHGRAVVYTHVNGLDRIGLPDSVVAMYVASHADAFYTETTTGGHEEYFWQGSYDYKYLLPWIFDKHRLTPGVIKLTDPVTYRTFDATATLSWIGGAPGDSVELWFSPDAGKTWKQVEHSLPNTGTYLWATNNLQDCGLGLINIFLKGASGHIYGRDQSAFFAVDHAGNAPPTVVVLRDPRIVLQEPWIEDTATVSFRIADPEGDTVHVSLLYSPDRGTTFEPVENILVPPDSLLCSRLIGIGPFANSGYAFFQVTASDGLRSSVTRTPAFIKQTPRPSGQHADQTVGMSGTVIVHIVDASQTTGNLYRVVFSDSLKVKSYDVFNVTKGLKAVSHAAVALDTVTEGPMFDGIRLQIKDYDPAQPDVQNSHWEIGSSLFDFVVSTPVIDMGDGTTISGFPYPADYTISVSSTVVDTSSSAIFGAERIPMKFLVRNRTEGRKVEVVYVDQDGNRQLSHLDELYILEHDSLGNPMLTWGLVVKAPYSGAPPPSPGDEFLFKTFKPIKNGDVYEFRGTVSTVQRINPLLFRLEQNYPNPFNSSTRISFAVGKSGLSRVEVYNILGQRIATLFSGIAIAGQPYVLAFDAAGLASGVYFYRLTAGSYVQTRKLLLVR